MNLIEFIHSIHDDEEWVELSSEYIDALELLLETAQAYLQHPNNANYQQLAETCSIALQYRDE